MDISLWSWVPFVVSVVGLWIAGYNPKVGWWYAIANQLAVWLIYAALTRQWGLVATSVVFTVIYARNLYRWRHTRMPSPNQQPATSDT